MSLLLSKDAAIIKIEFTFNQQAALRDGDSSGGHIAFSGSYVAPTGGGQGAPTGGYLGPTGGFSSPSSGLGQSGGGYTGGNGGLVDTYGYDAYDDVGRLVTRDTQVWFQTLTTAFIFSRPIVLFMDT